MNDKNEYLVALKSRNMEMYNYLQKALNIIEKITEKTYEAYIVGGAVRDFIMGKDFNDIDIATNATPNIIKEIFADMNIDDTYANLGSIVIRDNGLKFEITTFRTEEYIKYKLKKVHYSQGLSEDIKRRDFTINALALTTNLSIIDLVSGQRDLEKGIIRIIGPAKKRFEDDPSRILRGLHLMAKLGFDIDNATIKGMKKARSGLTSLGEYKINALIRKIITEKYGLKCLRVINDNNLFKDLPVYDAWVKVIIKGYKKLSFIDKMTILYLIMDGIPENTSHSHQELEQIKKLIELTKNIMASFVTPIMVFDLGQDVLIEADKVAKFYVNFYRSKEKDIPKYKSQKANIKKIYKKLVIHSPNQLDYTNRELLNVVGDDIILISEIMRELIVKVINRELANNNFELRTEALKILNRLNNSKEETPISEEINESEPEEVMESEPEIEEEVTEKVPFDELEDLKEEYQLEFNNLYNSLINSIKNYYDLSEREQQIKMVEVRQQAKDVLLKNNPKYRILHQKGII